MQFEWIIVGLLALSSCCSATSTNYNTTNDSNNISNITNVNNSDIQRMWAAAFQAINDEELRRIGQRPPSNALETVQRPNSKRMKWRTNSKRLERRAETEALAAAEAESRSPTYPSTEVDNVNPSYVDVKDHTPRPVAWWF